MSKNLSGILTQLINLMQGRALYGTEAIMAGIIFIILGIALLGGGLRRRPWWGGGMNMWHRPPMGGPGMRGPHGGFDGPMGGGPRGMGGFGGGPMGGGHGGHGGPGR